MAETGESVFGRMKEFLSDRFCFVEKYHKFIHGHQKPLSWSDSDVDAFITRDPVHGPALNSAREVTQFAAAGSVLGAVNLAGIAWKYSKSPHGTALSLAAGAVFGWTFGHEIGSHYHQLYRMDTMGAQVKFLEWLESKKGVSS
ncbi:succinate dehydrogenase subunit 6, mitochondrial [Heracleum sosnowskyi]|uniref:Succinate dehydrogenase subunit 6, mitochondrial n=1 Tax=Heracleum sosnowskyi TaxID=360622 RepID=A0AAD8GYB1_9APIA|nr:succinate dehydrogenase subunit 6, mitochondrial [Heracleum sosnowskyi]